jgi:hypothetical protein
LSLQAILGFRELTLQHLESATRPKITKMFLTMTITMTMMMMMMVVVVVMMINYYY